nr:MAG TPA: hypothetical protein [Caudoviricetes sp.]
MVHQLMFLNLKNPKLSYLLYIAKVGQVFYSTKYLSKYFYRIIVSSYITAYYDLKIN